MRLLVKLSKCSYSESKAHSKNDSKSLSLSLYCSRLRKRRVGEENEAQDLKYESLFQKCEWTTRERRWGVPFIPHHLDVTVRVPQTQTNLHGSWTSPVGIFEIQNIAQVKRFRLVRPGVEQVWLKQFSETGRPILVWPRAQTSPVGSDLNCFGVLSILTVLSTILWVPLNSMTYIWLK
jgi:hypothetical protein